MKESRLRIGVAFALIAGGVCAPALSAQQVSGQVQSTPAPPATYGTASQIVFHLGPADFICRSSGQATCQHNESMVYLTSLFSGSGTALAPLHLPNGAVIDSFDYFYWDNHQSVNPSAALILKDVFGVETDIAPVNFFPNVANGYVSFPVTLQFPVPINNFTTRYLLRFSLFYDDNTAQGNFLFGVRVNYRLRVSPAPGTATFADVPVGNPFHQFVEALVGAGITGGCGGGNYCPNAPVTRGQMAVFLAAALGLHWPN